MSLARKMARSYPAVLIRKVPRERVRSMNDMLHSVVHAAEKTIMQAHDEKTRGDLLRALWQWANDITTTFEALSPGVKLKRVV